MATRPPNLGFVVLISALFFIPFFYLLFVYYPIEIKLRCSISLCFAMSLGGFTMTVRFVPVTGRYLLWKKMFAYDIGADTIKLPRPLGIVTGIVFFIVAIMFQEFYFKPDSNWLVEYNAALASICFTTLLGFVDDVLHLPLSLKVILPGLAAFPLVVTYVGKTSFIIPKSLIPHIGLSVLDLDVDHKACMIAIALFCTHAINIHGGLNGLEVGQTIVISFAILIYNLMQIGTSADPEYKQAHAFSIYIILPLLTTSLALLPFNWYPSIVFVGNTYTYFAGMTFAAVGILGHFSGTLLLLFLPQLLGIVPCPMDRLPVYEPETGLMTSTMI